MDGHCITRLAMLYLFYRLSFGSSAFVRIVEFCSDLLIDRCRGGV